MGLLTFGKSPLDSKPKPYGGLLSPVIWDRVRRGPSSGRQMELPFEGAGGRGGGSALLKITNQKKEWTPQWEELPYGTPGSARTHTPAGSEVSFHNYDGRVVVEFWPTRGPPQTSARSTRRGIGRLEDVYRAVRSYVDTYKPREIKFSGATDSHDKVYGKIAPKMAKDLGGEFTRSGSYFKITLPTLD